MTEAMALSIPGLFPALFVLYGVAAWTDLTRRIIPNTVCVLVAAVGVTGLFFVADSHGVATLAIAIATFAALAFLCAIGRLGGGDAKLISATVLLVGAAHALDFFLLTALAGGVLSLVYVLAGFAFRRMAPRPLGSQQTGRGPFRLGLLWRVECRRIRRGGPLPYGVAIVIGALMTLSSLPV